MPPRRYSRYQRSTAYTIDDPKRGEIIYLEEPTPCGFVVRSDTRMHMVEAGDTWHNLAAKYFPSFPRPEQLYFVIMDFQPVPVVDPTIPLATGTLVYVPSETFVTDWVFANQRTRTAGI